MIIMKLAGIPGDCQREGKAGWIVVESLSWEIAREIRSGKKGGKQGTRGINLGVAKLPALICDKSTDRSSVYLMQHSIAGGALSNPAFIELLDIGGEDGEPKVYMRYKLARPIVQSWSIYADGDDRPIESVAILYSKIFMETFATKDGVDYQRIDGKGWDVIAGKAWAG